MGGNMGMIGYVRHFSNDINRAWRMIYRPGAISSMS